MRYDVFTYVFLGLQICLVEDFAVWHWDGDLYFCIFYSNSELFKGVCCGGVYNVIIVIFGENPSRIKDFFKFAIEHGGNRRRHLVIIYLYISLNNFIIPIWILC